MLGAAVRRSEGVGMGEMGGEGGDWIGGGEGVECEVVELGGGVRGGGSGGEGWARMAGWGKEVPGKRGEGGSRMREWGW